MQYFDTSDTFSLFLMKKSGEIGEDPRTSFDALILSIFSSRVDNYSEYNLSLLREASIVRYSDARDAFLTTKEILLDTLAQDMRDIDTDASTIYDISQNLEKYSTHLEEVTSALIHLMPLDAFEIRVFPNPDLYREALFEENSWIEGEAESMRLILSKWMQIHKSEVQGEKEKLNLLMQESRLGHIISLIQTTWSLLDKSSEKVIDAIE